MTISAVQIFEKNRREGRSTLVGYFPAGFPTLQDSVDACVAMCKNGVDILELGVPYSDPVMDGAVIQAATEEALNAGFKLNQVFDAISEIRKHVETPILVMTYWNPVVQYGVRRFAQALKVSGASGLITPDLVVDEASEWIEISDELSLERVFLATPTSTQERVDNIASVSKGFVYCVSTMGITGAREDLDSKAKAVVAKVRQASPEQNTAVGIGISTPEQVAEVNGYADAAIVGSVFVKAYANGKIEELSKVTRKLAGLN